MELPLWLWISLAIYSIYAVGMIFLLRSIVNKSLRYLHSPPPNFMYSCTAAARYDAVYLNLTEMILTALFITPIRIAVLLTFVIITTTIVLLFKLIFWGSLSYLTLVSAKNNQRPRGKVYVWLVWRSYFLMRLILWGLGFSWVTTTKLKIKDVFADYEPVQDTSVAPMVVSNHVSFADMFFYLTKNVSFLSKDAVANVPLIGWHCTARQSIYLNREDNKDRDKVLEHIRNRCRRVREHGDVAPLMIFPEGTITNGRTLMSFKKGAFFNGDPIKIYALKYNTDSQAIASIININAGLAALINLTQFWNKLEVLEYEDHFDPEWVYRKYNLKKEDPHAWEKVASETKKLMQFISGFECTEDGYRETLEFEEKSLEIGKSASQRSSRNSKHE